MKKLLLPLLLLISGFIFGQGTPCSNYQQFGSGTTRTAILGLAQGQKGVTVGRYADTATANSSGCADYYPGTLIITDNPLDVLWQRNFNATKWINRGSGGIDSITFITDSSIIICFASGSCDTIPINNFTTIINNIIQNFNDSNVYNLNDSTLIICVGEGAARVCDTINLGNTNNYFFLNDSTLVTCDTLETICIGDSCYQQQLCDTIPVPRIISHQFQEGLYTIPGTQIHELGAPFQGEGGPTLYRNTYLYASPGILTIDGKLFTEPFIVQQRMVLEESPSIQSWFHIGRGYSAGIDNPNTVSLRINYTDPFYLDSSGFVFDRIGYLVNTNARGSRYSMTIDNVSSKQTGYLLHTLDTANTDAMTIFGTQTPKNMAFPLNPPPTSTWYEDRIAVFKTDGTVQFNAYPNSRDDGASPDGKGFYTDANGNLLYGEIGGGAAGITADNAATASTSTNVQFGSSSSTGSPLLHHTYLYGASTYVFNLNDVRFNMDEGANITSAAALALGLDGNTFTITGNTTVECIGSTNWQDGAEIFLLFTGTPTLVNESVAVCSGIPLKLSGRVNFAITSETMISFVKKDGYWIETIRQQAGASAVVAANNGLSIFGSSTVQLFGPLATPATLLNDRYLSTGVFNLNIASTVNGYTVDVINTHASADAAIKGTTTLSGNGVQGQSTTQAGVFGQGIDPGSIGVSGISPTNGVFGVASDVGYGVYGAASNGGAVGIGGFFEVKDDLTNNVTPIVQLRRYSDGVAAAGIGGSLDFITETSTGSSQISNEIISKWITATHASRYSQLDITGVGNAVTGIIMSAYGSGVVGIGISSSYTATRLHVVDNSLTTGIGILASSSSLSSGSLMSLVVTGTAGTNLQKGLNISLSGANSSASQTTYGLFVRNFHTGTTPTNIGIYSDVLGAEPAIYGVGDAGAGVYANAISGIPLQSVSSNNYAASFQNGATATNSVVSTVKMISHSTGTAANGFGGAFEFHTEDASSNELSNQLISKWIDVTHGTRTSEFSITGVTAATTETWLTIGKSGYVKFRPMTVTEAGAIATAEGLMVFVSNTDGTFTSVGLWIFQNGAWKAL